ncbi:MAG: hypothetical protein JWM31_3353, partial [Solirubrobacterales bacterium]|nr:hypothetical protein [Solirubrobacterales bacterium]
ARSRERVVLAATQGEHHAVGLRMAADVLEGAGYDVHHLGADVPLDELLQACRRLAPAAVGLSVTMPANVPTLLWEIDALGRLDAPPAVFAAGPALGPAIQQGLDVPRIDGVEGLVAIVEALLAQPAGRRVLPPGLTVCAPGPAAFADTGVVTSGTRDEAFARTALSAADAARDAARHAAALEHLAFRDALTGLWNRRGYDDHHGRIAPPAGPGGAVLMLDVDRFKDVNDSRGHAGGDAVLTALATTMLRSVRPADVVARLGGDEFAILLPGTDVPGGLAVARRIRQAIRDELTDPAVTVSIGVSPVAGSQRQTSLAADRALYDAKEQGRDRVVVAGR